MQSDTIKPGFYPGMSFEDYAAIPAMNNTALKWAYVSMAHLRACLDGKLEREDTPALAFGRALHCRLLEPAEYKIRFTVAGPCCAVLASGKNKGESCNSRGQILVEGGWLCGRHAGESVDLAAGKELIDHSDAVAIDMAAEAVKDHAVVQLLRRRGGFETSAVAELDGLLWKVRLDKWIEGKRGTIIDLKKVRVGKARLSDFERMMLPPTEGMSCYGYGMQAHIYCRVVEALTGEFPHFFFVLVEDAYPHGVNVFEVDSQTHDVCRAELACYIDRIKRCQESGVWPGYANANGDQDSQVAGLPDWYVKRCRDAGMID